MFTYWLTSNCFSLGQVALLKHPWIRDRLRIPERIQHPASAIPQSDGLIESMKKGSCRSICPIDYDIRTFAGLVFGSVNFGDNSNVTLIVFLSVQLWFAHSGWKNAHLAHQLQERENRIKNHLDLAAKGQSQQDFISFSGTQVLLLLWLYFSCVPQRNSWLELFLSDDDNKWNLNRWKKHFVIWDFTNCILKKMPNNSMT